MAAQFIIPIIVAIVAIIVIIALTVVIVLGIKGESLTVFPGTTTNMPLRIRGSCSSRDAGSLRCVSA